MPAAFLAASLLVAPAPGARAAIPHHSQVSELANTGCRVAHDTHTIARNAINAIIRLDNEVLIPGDAERAAPRFRQWAATLVPLLTQMQPRAAEAVSRLRNTSRPASMMPADFSNLAPHLEREMVTLLTTNPAEAIDLIQHHIDDINLQLSRASAVAETGPDGTPAVLPITRLEGPQLSAYREARTSFDQMRRQQRDEPDPCLASR